MALSIYLFIQDLKSKSTIVNKHIYVYGNIFQTDLYVLIKQSQYNFPQRNRKVTKMGIIVASSS